MKGPEFESHSFVDGDHSTIAALFGGFQTSPEEMLPAARGLKAMGHDVVLYQYSQDVLMSGHPELFGELLEGIREDLAGKSANYDSLRFVGMSMGMALGINLQRDEPKTTKPGIFAAGGSDMSLAVMCHPLFIAQGSRRRYLKNGYDLDKLTHEWQPYHQSPNSPFTAVLGVFDHVVPYLQARRRFSAWRENGTPNDLITLKTKSHTGTMQWSASNMPVLVEHAELLVEQ